MSDQPKKLNNLQIWRMNLTPEQRAAHAKRMAQVSFKAGDERTIAAGSKGGKATGPTKARDMKGKQRVKPRESLGRDLQTTRGMDQ